MTGLSKNDNFLNKAKYKFNNKFEYFNDYTHINNIIKIKCNIHKLLFEVSARTHLATSSGSCPICKTNNMKNIKQIDSTHFIERSKKKFGEKFNYSKVNYINKKEDIMLICIKHNNEFKIEPKSHYYSTNGGCNICNKEDITNKPKLVTKKNFNFSKCDYCKNNIKKSLSIIENICKKCKNKKIKNIINIGNIIEDTVIMRLKFNNDEYIKKICIDGLDKYFVSNYGKILNERKEILKGHLNMMGYNTVRLFYNNKNTLFRVHRLVCITFNGLPINNKIFVDHINRIRNDNRSINLRWVTQKENMNNKSITNINNKKLEILNDYNNLNKNDEIFKPIKNSLYGNFSNYLISNYGRIKNSNKIMKPTITDDGYLMIKLYLNNKVKNIPIHRLVCEIFNNKPITELVVNHINEIKNDNYYKNLEWVTVEKNNQHSKNIKICMIDDDNNIIKYFDSFTDAYKYFNKTYTRNIQHQLKRKAKAYGYYWKII